MFARKVSMHLKPNNAAELTRKLEKEIIPSLRKVKGFCDEIVFVGSYKKHLQMIAISLWDREEDAKVYNSETYPDVVKSLGTLIEGTPKVKTYEVCNSTFHKIPVAV